MSKASYRQISGPQGYLVKLQSFKGNTMSAENNPSYIPKGRLSNEWREILEWDYEHVGIQYVVWSYGTPIAWVRNDYLRQIPDDKYSVTTSRQQGYVRAWLPGMTLGIDCA